MKRIILIIALFTASIMAQDRAAHPDSTSAGSAYTSSKRHGVAIMGRSDGGLFRMVLVDSSGYLMTTDAIYDGFVEPAS